MTNNIAIITARGGSKRVPGKNIRAFAGKPIICYSIEAALESGLFSEVMVSTDSEEIAAVARKAGALVPFMRSADNSNDYATTADVLEEVLLQYQQHNKQFDLGCCIYPTAPFVTAAKLRLAFEKITATDSDTIFPVSEYSSSIWRAYRMKENRLTHFWPENANKRSQDLEPAYFDCGQFYFFRTERFLRQRSLITANSLGIEVPQSEVQDIDTEEDWQMAELKYLYAFRRNDILPFLNTTNNE